MSILRYDDRGWLYVKKPTKNRPPNPLHGYNGTKTASIIHSTVASSVTSFVLHAKEKDQNLLNKLTLTDQRSFISGSCTASMQAFHFINAVRVRKSTPEAKADAKKLSDEIMQP